MDGGSATNGWHVYTETNDISEVNHRVISATTAINQATIDTAVLQSLTKHRNEYSVLILIRHRNFTKNA